MSVRKFETGATRSPENMIVPSGFLSAPALMAFCTYMAKHRIQSDGQLRAPDNWKKGIPLSSYYESLIRHVIELMLRREPGGSPFSMYPDERPTEIETLCAIMFNVQGMLHEMLKGSDWRENEQG